MNNPMSIMNKPWSGQQILSNSKYKKSSTPLEAVGGSSRIPGKQTLCHVQFDAFLLSISKLRKHKTKSEAVLKLKNIEVKPNGMPTKYWPKPLLPGRSLKAESLLRF